MTHDPLLEQVTRIILSGHREPDDGTGRSAMWQEGEYRAKKILALVGQPSRVAELEKALRRLLAVKHGSSTREDIAETIAAHIHADEVLGAEPAPPTEEPPHDPLCQAWPWGVYTTAYGLRIRNELTGTELDLYGAARKLNDYASTIALLRGTQEASHP